MPRIALAAVLLVTLSSTTIAPSAARPAGELADHSPTQGPGAALTQDQHAWLDWAHGRFERSGFDLPDELTVWFPTDPEACRGFGGLYRIREIEVRICRPSMRTVIHEFAHAWTETTLSDERKQAFLDLRGLDSWLTGDEWHDLGAEQAAEVLTWALLPDDTTVSTVVAGLDGSSQLVRQLERIPDSDVGSLLKAYVVLTGELPLDRVADLTG